MFEFNDPALFVKGTADMFVFNIQTGDIEAYTDKIDTNNLTSSMNNGEVTGGLGSPVLINIPDSARFTGEVTAQDFSLKARQLQTGGTLSYNAAVMVAEEITATGTTLTVSQTPVAAYGESPDSTTYSCYVDNDKKNYGVDPTTKQVQGFTATTGQKYCVKYFANVASAQVLTIPATFTPGVKRIIIRMACYTAQGANRENSSFDGYLYIHIPYAQFIDGDAGVNGSQTEIATTTWTFSSLSYREAVKACSECALDTAVLGYMVYAPCGDRAQSVEGLVVVGGSVTVATSAQVQIPVYYVMPDNTIVTPNYADLTFESVADETATVSEEGVVEGVAQGNTTININITSRPEIKTTCAVEVTAA